MHPFGLKVVMQFYAGETWNYPYATGKETFARKLFIADRFLLKKEEMHATLFPVELHTFIYPGHYGNTGSGVFKQGVQN